MGGGHRAWRQAWGLFLLYICQLVEGQCGYVNVKCHLTAVPNEALIPYSNGGLDPWSAGGVTQNVTDSLVAIVIPDGAHHLDLRSRNPCDPKSVQQARALEVHYMKQWIAEAKHQHWSGTVTTVAIVPLLALLGSGPGLVVHALSVPLLLPYPCCSAHCCLCPQEN